MEKPHIVEKPHINVTSRRRWLFVLAAILFAGVLYSLDALWRSPDSSLRTRSFLLQQMPSDARGIFFVDFQALRESSFGSKFSAWLPKLAIDPDYLQFCDRTGFDLQRDLQQIAMAATSSGADSHFFLVAQGRFDQARLQAYAEHSAVHERRSDVEIFSFELPDRRKISLTFLDRSTIAVTDAPDLVPLLHTRRGNFHSSDWDVRFARLAGSSIFTVIHLDTDANATAASLHLSAPIGLQSPQLSTLLNQLQWVTLAGKPQDSALQVVLEGECQSEQTARQLADLLNGALLMAKAGLDSPQMRRQLGPASRDAYLELAKTVDVNRFDRGETKSVRIIFDITPKLLDAIRTESSAKAVSDPVPQRIPNAPAPKKTPKAAGK